jgi:hypothetical protein
MLSGVISAAMAASGAFIYKGTESAIATFSAEYAP